MVFDIFVGDGRECNLDSMTGIAQVGKDSYTIMFHHQRNDRKTMEN